MLDITKIKQLRAETGISIYECQKAIEQAQGDLEKAKVILKKLGRKISAKKIGTELKEGIIECYIHPNRKIGAMIELCCQTDFVAKSEEFKKLAHNLALQIAAMKPEYVKFEDIPKQIIEKEKEIYKDQFEKMKKPKEIIDKIIQGKLKKHFQEVCLIEQSFIKDPEKKIKDIIDQSIAKIGEKIIIKRFVRYEI